MFRVHAKHQRIRRIVKGAFEARREFVLQIFLHVFFFSRIFDRLIYGEDSYEILFLNINSYKYMTQFRR